MLSCGVLAQAKGMWFRAAVSVVSQENTVSAYLHRHAGRQGGSYIFNWQMG